MRNILFALLFMLPVLHVAAQRQCVTTEYRSELFKDPLIANAVLEKEAQLVNHSKSSEILSSAAGAFAPKEVKVIKIPVVVHVLYNRPEENISYQQILSQIEVLNKDFRNKNQVSGMYSNLSADSYIEFQLATVDPNGNPTSGVIRKKTDIKVFSYDDRIKFSSKGGSNAWDSKSYLNIWTGNLAGGLAGYSSPVGGKAENDGVVIRFNYFGKTSSGEYGFGRTATHEIGHWLGLNHIWGDSFCGDDGVEDTPPQQTFTSGCPTGNVVSCGNTGNMFMNFMDYTSDVCVNMFTHGQANRMRKLFEPGAYRNEILQSAGLSGPVVHPDEDITEPAVDLKIKSWPNPVSGILNIQFNELTKIQGSKVSIFNSQGQEVHSFKVSTMHHRIDMHAFRPGLYFITTSDRKRALKFIKQ